MPEDKRPLKVFLCHAHSDKDKVRILYLHLKRDGVDAWLDKEKLLPGSDWEYEIRKAVREADVVIVCLSKQFNQAGFRQKEVRLALDTAMEQPEGEIFIIPARLEECDSIESLRKWHWVDLFEENGYLSLIRALRARAKRIGAIPIAGIEKVVDVYKNSTPLLEKLKLKKPSRKLSNAIIFALISIVGMICAIFMSSPILATMLVRTPEPSVTPPVLPTGTKTLVPLTLTKALVLTKTPTKVFTPTITPLPTEFTDPQGVPMRLVPAGNFKMGSDLHTVYLSSFYMDKYEVTNVHYKSCVTARMCLPPKNNTSFTHPYYYGNSKYDDYPVIYVNWYQAKSYCAWRGPLVGVEQAHLPTEAQWEKAARGTDERIYPWGNEFDGNRGNFCTKVCPFYWRDKNFDDGYADVAPVGSYPNGISPYGIYDLAGNVEEWVSDWYSETSYALRGGTFHSSNGSATSRNGYNPDVTYYTIGFRCARSVSP